MTEYKFNISRENATIHPSKGNSKTGAISAWSMVPADGFERMRDGRFIADVYGTCGKACKACKHDCYARRIYRMARPSVVTAWAENTVMARERTADFMHGMIYWLMDNHPAVFRIHVSGEFFNYHYLKTWAVIADLFDGTHEHNGETMPRIKFYSYTKRTDLLAEFERKHGALPSNLTIHCSQWHGETPNPTNAPQFIYDDGAENLENVFHCPAVGKPSKKGGKGTKTGVTCEQCKRCWNVSNGDMTAVYAH